MYPYELEPQIFTLPKKDRDTIVIATGSSLRHKRFAYRIIQEFGKRVVKWYEIDNSYSNITNKNTKSISKIDKITTQLDKLKRSFQLYGIKITTKKVIKLADDIYYKLLYIKRLNRSLKESEYRLFAKEIESIKKYSHIQPTKIDSNDIYKEWFLDELKSINPYYFLTLSGPLYPKEIIESVNGVAINQHAGFSPYYKGSNTTHWALYHRDLKHLGSTIHLTSSGADSGAILRRSNPTIFVDDDPVVIFLRTVALGTELMIESVKEIDNSKEINIFPQSNSGTTYLNKDYRLRIIKSIIRDFKARWLEDELARRREF